MSFKFETTIQEVLYRVDLNTEVVSKKGDTIIVEKLTRPLESFFGMDIFEVRIKGGDKILISQEAVDERL